MLALSQTKEEKQARKQAIANRDKYLFAAKPVQKNFTITVPYTGSYDQIIVPVVIAGETYNFLFDTGAATVVSTQLKNKLNMRPVFNNKMSDGAGTVQEEDMYAIGDVQFAGVTFNNVVGPAVDMSKFEKLFCIKLDGILGTNIMRTCRWKIDYNAKTLTFSDKKLKPDSKMKQIDFVEGFSGSPMIKHAIGEYSYWAIMDTCYNGGFSIPDSLFFKSRVSKKLPYKKGTGNSALTLFDNKPVDEHVALADSLYIGNLLAKNQVLKIVPGNTALTGNEFFKSFGVVMIDWNKSKVYVPDAPIKDNAVMNTFGFTPTYVDETLKGGMVWETSSAGRAGIELGDTIVSINSKTMKGLPQQEWCELLNLFLESGTSGNDMQIVVQKADGSQKAVQLKKSNLLDN